MNRPARTLGTAIGTTTVATLVATAAIAAGLSLPSASATVEPGTPAKDVHIGLDNDNASNTFIQPAGVTAPQHMDNSDLLFGRGQDDLLFGGLGSDTLLGQEGSDILVGGPDLGRAPSSDTLVGDIGDDIGIWSPGDGNDVFAADEGSDTMIFGPLVTGPNGKPLLQRQLNRTIPRVTLAGHPSYGCTLVKVPPAQQLGVQYLVRFTVGSAIVATVRLKDVERVICPAAAPGSARTADLTQTYPTFRTVPLSSIPGVVGAIVAPSA